ncbi:MAG: universal stress protein [Anaerolineales bacterium]|jgi:nucleotide-binding universal stress UspA family protein
MFDPILIPLDGSQLAECVLPQVIAIGQAFNAKIVLLHVMDKNPSDASTQFINLLNWQTNKTEANLYLERITDRLEKVGLRTTAIVLEGQVAESITEFARSQEMKLVIMSSHGSSGVRKSGISRVTEEITLSAPTSVLIVRAHQPQEKPLSRILVPLDGSWRAEYVLPMVTLLARYHNAQVQIAHVVKTPEMARQIPPAQEDIELSDRVVARNREEALKYLEQVRSVSPLAAIDVKTHLIVSDNAPLAIHEIIDQEKIDLVALNAHGYSGNDQWPYGSMVNNFVLYGKVPLLIVQDHPIKEQTSQVHRTVKEHTLHIPVQAAVTSIAGRPAQGQNFN